MPLWTILYSTTGLLAVPRTPCCIIPLRTALQSWQDVLTPSALVHTCSFFQTLRRCRLLNRFLLFFLGVPRAPMLPSILVLPTLKYLPWWTASFPWRTGVSKDRKLSSLSIPAARGRHSASVYWNEWMKWISLDHSDVSWPFCPQPVFQHLEVAYSAPACPLLSSRSWLCSEPGSLKRGSQSTGPQIQPSLQTSIQG